MTSSRASAIGEYLPFLRRYARAMTGSQELGDHYALATLSAILKQSGLIEPNIPLKVALYRVMYDLDPPIGDGGEDFQGRAHRRLSTLSPPRRAALLLHTIEELSILDISLVMQRSVVEVAQLIDEAHAELQDSIAGYILIIEDEPLIALELQDIAAEQGHTVTGVARTHLDALTLGTQIRPDLILADIQLADHSSGVDAVNALLNISGEIPVIFITAFPEKLLTGTRPEPAFLIAKPFNAAQVYSAISQAMFFASVAGMEITPETTKTV